MTTSSDEEEKARKKEKKAAKKEKKQKKKDKKRRKLAEDDKVVVKETSDKVVVEETVEVTNAEEDPPKLQDDNDGGDTQENQGGDAQAVGGEGGTKRKRKRKRKRKAGASDNAEGEEETIPATEQTDLSTHTVFVEGIPFDASVDDVKHFFLQSLQDSDILELRLPTWQDTGRLRGFGHVRLVGKEAYEKALALNRQYMGQRYLSIQPAKDSTGGGANHAQTLTLPPPDGCLTLFVNNLPYGAGEAEIASAFAKRSNVNIDEENVRIARNSVTRQSKGFCYIEFDSVRDLETAVKASQQRPIVMSGRAVRLDYDTGRMKGSFRSDSGRLWTKEQTEKKRQQQQGGRY